MVVTLVSSVPKALEWKFTLSPVYTIDLDSHGSVRLSADCTRTSSLYNDTENTPLLRWPGTKASTAPPARSTTARRELPAATASTTRNRKSADRQTDLAPA